jgi:hypothetical protein
MLIKTVFLHSEEALVLLACLSTRIPQDLNKVLDLAAWVRQDKAVVHLGNVEIKMNV